MKASRLFIALAVLSLLAMPLLAQEEPIKLSGPHYTLNILGKSWEDKELPKMINSDRHTIFVALSKSENVLTNIYLQNGYDFRVCDGNGFDDAFDCNGKAIKSYAGATFQLPCNTIDTLAYDEGFGCPGDVATRSYNVYARALGKPGPNVGANMMTCATETQDFDNDGKLDQVCSTENVLSLKREGGRSYWQDATSQLTTLQADVDGDTKIEVIALFADGFEDFLWQYDNKGLRLAQIRFYPVIE